MKKRFAVIIAGTLTAVTLSISSAASSEEWESAPLSFSTESMDITGGTLSWSEESMEWKAAFPSAFGEITLSGTYDEAGTMSVLEDSTGGHASDDIDKIQEVFARLLEGWRSAPLSFSSESMDITGGTLSWNENTNEWEAVFPSAFGDITLSGTYDEDGTMTVLEDSTGGHASDDIDLIQPVFSDALQGIFQEEAETVEYPENAFSAEIEAIDDYDGIWQAAITDIAKKYDPEQRNHDTIFYGASNFAYWTSMEEDLAPFSVENHAFGGSTDKDLEYWAKYMLYPYQPALVFFQTGSNDYVESDAETDGQKVSEAMEFKKKMFAEFHESMPDAKFIVMSGLLLPGRKEYVDMTLDINDQLKEFCESTEYMYYIDAESLTYDRETSSFVDDVESLFKEDQIHLTDSARITWAQNWILPMMKELKAPEK